MCGQSDINVLHDFEVQSAVSQQRVHAFNKGNVPLWLLKQATCTDGITSSCGQHAQPGTIHHTVRMSYLQRCNYGKQGQYLYENNTEIKPLQHVLQCWQCLWHFRHCWNRNVIENAGCHFVLKQVSCTSRLAHALEEALKPILWSPL